MAKVLRRRFRSRGTGSFTDLPATWEAADKLAGRRVDRRRNYCIIDGNLCEAVEFTMGCSGCTAGLGHDVGVGCSECGYTGKRRMGHWLEYRLCEVGRAIDREEGARSGPS